MQGLVVRVQSLDKLFDALLGNRGLAPRDCGIGHGNRVDPAVGTPALPLAFDQGLQPVEAQAQQSIGSPISREEVDAELFRLSRSTELHADLKRGIAGHILRVVGSS